MTYVRFFCFVFILLARNIQAENISFVAVDKCPMNKTDWINRVKVKDCQDPPDYFCASISEHPGRFGEICTKRGSISSGYCGVLDKNTLNFDYEPCRDIRGCPDEVYTSSEIYKFPVCFDNFYGETTQSSTIKQSTNTVKLMREPSETDNGQSGTDVGTVFAVVVVVLILLITIALVIVFVLYRQNKLPTQMESFLTERIEGSRFLHWFGNETRRSRNLEEGSVGENEKMLNITAQAIHTKHRPEKLILMFQRYLTRILKTKLKVTELQENIILCSKSLKEHFNEYLIKDLNEVKTEKDYDNLDMNLVFTLLINFCKDIKPPGKGWGYEPPNDDNSEEADIERIRSMCNKYCDNDHHYPQLEDVYRRMVERYGEISKRTLGEDDTIEDMRTKYQVSILKEDCTVEDEVVVTENIKSALQLLETSDIVICRGAIGCGKTTAMRYIQKQFQDKQWRTIWMDEFVDDSDLSENDIENTLLCCDNLFGTFSCNLFPLDSLFRKLSCNVHSAESPPAFQDNLEKKRKIYGKHLKIMLGIHNHVYDMVIKRYAVELFQNQTRIIDMDEHTQAELLLIWKEEQKTDHCVHDSNCWFKQLNFSSVSAKLSLNSQGIVGNPLLLLMYCHHHHFFSNDEFTKSPVSALVEHFKKMRKECSELFYALVYIMFVTVYDKDQGLEDWAGSVDACLTTQTAQIMVEKFPEYFYEDEKTIELKHELLNITLFKVAVEIPEVQTSLVSCCGLHIILQLARTEEKSENEFINQFSLFEDRQKKVLRKRITESNGKQVKKPRVKKSLKKLKRNRLRKSLKK